MQSPGQIATTTDGGDTWTVKALAGKIAQSIFFVNAATGFYNEKAGGGLWRTIDSGNHWTSVLSSVNTPEIYYPYFFGVDTGLVVSGNGIFSSTTNGGNSWKSLPQASILYSDVSLIYNSFNQLAFTDRDHGYYANPDGVTRTIDGGRSWQYSLNRTIDAQSIINVLRFPDVKTGFYKGDKAIYQTVDQGKSWKISCIIGADRLTGMSFVDSHTGWACTSKGRILKLED